ncbi:MAG: dihydrodipicolinate synthase family protein, partial [Bacteroidales bacterium]|nr:dihydrodipicolinate synthase family protein [Bacteroidales bacterium]
MGVALVTPFKQDDSIDFDALGRLVDYQIQNKADYLVVLGTTAETPSLTTEEKKEIVDFFKRRVNGQLPILLGCGGNCTANV